MWKIFIAYLTVLASVTPSVARAAPLAFWDRYQELSRILETLPDSARGLAEARIAKDADDFLGNWIVGHALARMDSLTAQSLLARRASGSGSQVKVAAALLVLDPGEEARAFLIQARDGYLRADRPSDASRAVLWNVIQINAKDAKRVEVDLTDAEALARRAKDPAALADVLLVRASFLAERDLKGAVAVRREALTLLEPLGPSYQLCECHRGIGNLLRRTGNLPLAEEHVRRALALAQDLHLRAEEGRSWSALGSIQQNTGKYGASMVSRQEGLRIALELGNPRDIAAAYGELGSIQVRLGSYRLGKVSRQKAIEFMTRAGGDQEDEFVVALDQLGGVEALLGNLEAARYAFERGLALARSHGYVARMPFLLLHLAQFHADLGEADHSLEYLNEGLDAAAASGHTRARVLLLHLKTQVLLQLDRPQEALPLAREAFQKSRQDFKETIWVTSRGVAETMSRLGQSNEAIDFLDSTLATFPDMPDSVEMAKTLELQGRIHLDSGRPESAIAVLSRSLNILHRFPSPDLVADVQVMLGQAFLAVGRLESALQNLRRGVNSREKLSASLTVREERSGFQAKRYEGYASLARTLLVSGKPDEAFGVLEQTRAREMRELFGVALPGLSQKIDPDLVQRLREVESDLSGFQAALLREAARPEIERSSDVPHLERGLDSLKTAWSDLRRHVEREDPAFARETGLLLPLDASHVKKLLKGKERLLAFMVERNATLLFDFRPGILETYVLPRGEKDLAQQVQTFTEALRSTTNWRALGMVLADSLLGPCRLAETTPSRLYIIPDGALHYLPFEALILRPPGGERFLVELTPVLYGNSATLLFHSPRELEKGRPVEDSVVAFGDPTLPAQVESAARSVEDRSFMAGLGPLPHARREATHVGSLFPGARILVGDRATEGAFYAEARHARILHVAAHAFADDRFPSFSGIVLAPETSHEDGLVQAFEVLEHRMPVALATLSACETGRGTLRRGEGLLGLSRAFRLAGAENLVVSLWKVDDEATADFMSEFYERLHRGDGIAEALRGAKLAFLREGSQRDGQGGSSRGVGKHARAESHAEPATWAPFILLGTRAPS